MNFSLSLKRRRNSKRILFNALKLLLVGWFAVFLILPLVFKFSYSLQRGLLFLNFVSYPSHIDLSRPETLGLYATRNFYLKYLDSDENKVSIAVWHIIPNHIVRQFHSELKIKPGVLRNITVLNEKYKSLEGIVIENKFDINDHRQEELLFEELLRKSNDPVILYLHGNTGTRANGHRIELYNSLRKLGYHIFAIDYRGFADSSEHSPTEKGCVSDGLAIYKYIKNLTRNPIYIYGHSLGTGISLHMASIIGRNNNVENPNGIILESPFNNMREEIKNHPLSSIFRHLPWFESTILKPIYDNGFRFESDHYISDFHAPVMIMHAENDLIVPLELGHELYLKAIETRNKSWGPVEFHRFEGNYGHKYIVRALNFSTIIGNFVNSYKNKIY
ncbi:hypothetical protein PVAND_011551 [Polypedilum vanderplanki]|uniref:AB hydrolase-1 domain-containing protein n=1 Tax=Polypedilum vanderplanki TaxID=319348 RepID=A0A9J6CJY6_POLVA|nr:hypothetical protein PVAND_011551 [Polypedilum vanderplanki]